MKLAFDKEADALLIVFREGPWHHSEDRGHWVTFEIGEDGDLMAISILNLSKRSGRPILDYLNINFTPEFEPVEIETDIDLPAIAKKAVVRSRRRSPTHGAMSSRA